VIVNFAVGLLRADGGHSRCRCALGQRRIPQPRLSMVFAKRSRRSICAWARIAAIGFRAAADRLYCSLCAQPTIFCDPARRYRRGDALDLFADRRHVDTDLHAPAASRSPVSDGHHCRFVFALGGAADCVLRLAELRALIAARARASSEYHRRSANTAPRTGFTLARSYRRSAIGLDCAGFVMGVANAPPSCDASVNPVLRGAHIGTSPDEQPDTGTAFPWAIVGRADADCSHRDHCSQDLVCCRDTAVTATMADLVGPGCLPTDTGRLDNRRNCAGALRPQLSREYG